MQLRRALYVFLPLATLLGGVAGFYLGTFQGSLAEMRSFGDHISLSYVDVALHAQRDVDYLNLFRAGNVAGGIDALEHDLDGDLAALSDFHEYLPREARRKAVYELIAKIRPYRAAHPTELPPGPKRDRVLRALALVPDSNGGGQ